MKRIPLLIILILTGCFFSGGVNPLEWKSISGNQQERLVFDVNNSDARILWETKSTPALYYSETGQLFIGADPVMSKSGILYIQSSDHTIKAMNPQTGTIITSYTLNVPFLMDGEYQNNSIVIFPVLNKGKNTITHFVNGKLYFLAIDEKKEQILLFANGYAFRGNSDSYSYYSNGEIIFATLLEKEAQPYIYNAKTGELEWHKQYKPYVFFKQKNNPGRFGIFKLLDVYVHNHVVYCLMDLHDNKHLMIRAYRLDDGKINWETTFNNVENDKGYKCGYHIYPFKAVFLFLQEKCFLKKDDLLMPASGQFAALNLSDGTIAWDRSGFVANYPDIKNTIYLISPYTNNILKEISPLTGKVITSSVFDDTRFLSTLFESPNGFMYYAKDAKHINYVDKYSLKIVWSKNIDIPMVINIVPEIRNDYFAFDIPAIAHKELGKRSYVLNPAGFTNTTYIADTETGKILWKARVEGVNSIVTRTVLADNNMAFIKTAAGTVFVVKWANKGK